MKFLKKIIVSIVTCSVVVGTNFLFNSKLLELYAYQNGTDHFSIVNEDGSVEFVYYDEDVHLMQDEEGVSLELSSVHAADNSNLDVAILPTGVVKYTEYDGTSKGRSGYTNGSSANYAAFIGYVNSDRELITDGTTSTIVRVKQAGVYMDINTQTYPVTLVNHSSLNSVDFYDVVNSSTVNKNYLYHNYYYTGTDSQGNSVRVAYATRMSIAPSYLTTGAKYYSFDGNYFYTDFDTMINDYRKSVYCHDHALNKDNPFYNYFQYLSVRTPSNYTASDLNGYLQSVRSDYASSVLNDNASLFIDAQNNYGVNALISYSDAALESAWGTSSNATDKKNIYGINVYDSNTGAGTTYNSIVDCIKDFSVNYITKKYLNPFSSLYLGNHEGNKQSGINVNYASDPYKGEKVAGIATRIDMVLGLKDIAQYQIKVSEISDVYFYKDTSCSDYYYISGPNDNDNDVTHNVAVTVKEESSNIYKVFSDAPINSSTHKVDTSLNYNYDRDYCYVLKTQVNSGQSCSHSYSTSTVRIATCTITGIVKYSCKKCGYTYTKDVGLNTSNHNYSNNVVSPTCTSNGYTVHTCSSCGSSYTDSVTSAIGHNFVTTTSAKITRAKVSTCTRCGVTSTGSTTTSKTIYKGNTYNEGVKGTWKSSNKKVATVTSKGKITAKKAGTCTITGKVNGKTYKCKITVKNKTLTVSKSSVSIKKGKSTTVTAKATPSATVKWSTSNKKIATVSNGKITGKKKGSCTITAKANGITKKIKVKVK